MQLKGNKGEWSELYVLFELLANQKLYSGDENLTKTSEYLIVNSIKRNEGIRALIYDIDNARGSINIIHTQSQNVIHSFPISEAKKIASDLVKEIKNKSGKAFSVSPRLEQSLSNLQISQVKEKSSNKGDIDMLIFDPSISITTQKKFSIKSLLGSDPTLFNSNKTTNIIYKITDSRNSPLPISEVNRINSINSRRKYMDRVSDIISKGNRLQVDSFEDQTFFLNLQLIDSDLPAIIGDVVLNMFSKGIKKFPDVISNLMKTNPMKYDLSQGHNFYEYRLVNFLVEAALGMTSKKIWKGIHDVIGGIIIVKPDENVLCYHLIDFNKFKIYLKNSCRLDNPSGSKMGYGTVFEKGGETYIKLNFQVKA